MPVSLRTASDNLTVNDAVRSLTTSYEAPIRTTCPYCGVGCGVLVSREGDNFVVRGDPEHPANLGRLCSKGAALGETLSLDDRLLYPEIDGIQTSWDTALDTVAQRFQQVIKEHGPDAVAFYVSGQLLTEDYYVANKLMKGYIGSGNIDTNSRLCMSSAVAGHKRAFGSDTVPGCYQDLELADLVVLIGSNAAWTHPVVFQRLVAAKKTRPEMKVVVIDPRRTASADLADLYLSIKPGADAWLFNGLLNHLKREDALDWAYLETHVEGFGTVLQAVSGLTIPAVARECGLSEAEVTAYYRLFTQTPKSVSVFSQGINQSSSGVDKVNSIINLHLATGRIGKPGATPFSITGQPNAMGGREVGGLANQLAAHMDFTPEAIDRVGRFWRAPNMAQQPGLKAVDLFEAVHDGRIKALWIMATNPAVSLPDSNRVAAALQNCPFVVVSDVVARTDTSVHAHVKLPAAAWGEKEGTVTNSERCISRQRAFMSPPGEVRPDWWIVEEVAQRMEFGAGFRFDGPADIFAEHAALSGFENVSPPPPAGEGLGEREGLRQAQTFQDFPLPNPSPACGGGALRDFDISALAGNDYDALQPTQWPVTAQSGTPRMFADGHFFTPSGKARMLPITPRAPVNASTETHPFILNTGRIRDQWHTMTRTGKAAKLLAHIDQPFIEIHPQDARRAGVRDGALARISNAGGEMLARVLENREQQIGSVFAPIHWNDQFTSQGRVGALIDAVTDPISGQPEFKQTPVAVEAYAASWHGFVMTRETLTPVRPEPVEVLPFDRLRANGSTPLYWARVRSKSCWRHEIAGQEIAATVAQQLHEMISLTGNWIEMKDPGATRYRGALIENERLLAVYFLEHEAHLLPPRHWLESLFERDTLNDAERRALLIGRPSQDVPDSGRVICACFGVGEKSLTKAIAEGTRSVEALGIDLKAGTNCGSCIPELKRLLQLP
jgi:assimilatory nitrate reductase catalytic subunit